MNCMRAHFVCLWILCSITQVSLAQFDLNLTNWSIPVYGQSAIFSNGIAIQDINFDGFDDIAVVENMKGIRIWLSNGTGFIFHTFITIQQDIKQISFVDSDNDQDLELFACAYGGGIYLWQSDDLMNWNLIQNAFSDYWGYHYGASWSDYDRDGDLDVFVCQYVDYQSFGGLPNLFFENQGNNNFIEMSYALGLSAITNNSFQSAWLDYNNDGWMDLYVVNDHYVPNLFYRNVQGEYFIESGQEIGANISMFCMSNSISDFDSDGDWDIFITDDNDPVLLSLDSNQSYQNIASSIGFDSLYNAWGALWVDADYDGDEDLHIAQGWINAPSNNTFYFNENSHFTALNSFDTLTLSSFVNAKGDFNNDGRWDIVVRNEYPVGIQIGMGTPDSSSNWVKIQLQGTVSNSFGKGATVEVYAGGITQRFLSQVGEGYIAQNSSSIIAGLSNWESIDSVAVIWPSTQREVWSGLGINASHLLIEGSAIQADTFFVYAITCPSQMSLVNLPENWYFDLENQIGQMELGTGFYELTIYNEWNWAKNCVISISESEVEPTGWSNSWNCELERYIVEWMGSVPFNPLGINYPMDTLTSGLHYINWETNLGCWQEDSIFLPTVVPPVMELLIPDTLCFGDSVNWSCNWQNNYAPVSILNVPQYVFPGNYEVQFSDSLGCLYAQDFTIYNWPELSYDWDLQVQGGTSIVSLEIEGGTAPYWVEINNEIVSNHIWTTDISGMFPIFIQDIHGCSLSDSLAINSTLGMTEFSSLDFFSETQTSVWDVNGRILFSGLVSPNDILNKLSLPQGIFIVKTTEGVFQVLKK